MTDVPKPQVLPKSLPFFERHALVLGNVAAITAALYVLLIFSAVVERFLIFGWIGVQLSRAIIYLAALTGIVGVVLRIRHCNLQAAVDRMLMGYFVALACVIIWQVFVFGSFGVATKSFLVGTLQIFGCSFLLALPAARPATRVCTAAVLVVASLLCLYDLNIFPAVGLAIGIFTDTPGRGAGLYSNPNIAALALVLGTLGVIAALKPADRLPIAVAVGLAMVATLSRSGILLALLLLLASLWSDRAGMKLFFSDWRGSAGLTIVLLLLGLSYLGVAYLNSPSFANKILLAQGKENPHTAPDVARRGANVPSRSTYQDRDSACDSWTVVLQGLTRAQNCNWMSSQNIDNAEYFNSVLARSLLGLRALASIADAPVLGSGLDSAYRLRPHNGYLLFAGAYGILGLLFIPAVCLLLFRLIGNWKKAVPLVVFVAVGSVFNHDIFLVRELVAGVAIALAGVSGDSRVG